MFHTTNLVRILLTSAAGLMLASANLAAQSDRIQRITLDQAQAQAAGSKAANLAQLGIDAARYHRQAAQADYFPKIDSSFANLHFNKFMGETIQLARRSAALPLAGKDQTVFLVTVTQPVTPLLKVREAVDIARADEEIAKAKATQSAAQIADNVERFYFALLIAQRQQAAAEARLAIIDSGLQVASIATPSLDGAERRTALLKASEELATANSHVLELSRSLNALIGFPPDTTLDLAPPEPAVETMSREEATQQAVANSPEVTEAEQTVVKARAATKLSKLEYVPDVAVIGGYSYETVIPLLPRDFSFIGAVATFNIFDFGKREKTVNERKTQLAMAEAAVELTKARVAANAQKAFLDLQRMRRIRDLARQLAAVPEDESARAQAEAEMFQAELDYRVAGSQLKRIIFGR